MSKYLDFLHILKLKTMDKNGNIIIPSISRNGTKWNVRLIAGKGKEAFIASNAGEDEAKQAFYALLHDDCVALVESTDAPPAIAAPAAKAAAKPAKVKKAK